IEAGGIGYKFEIMERDFLLLPELDTELKIYSILLHREDKMSLCGFLKREDRDIFNILTSVSGVGAKMALTLLNSFDVSDLVGFVLDGNYKELTRAKGVGPKLAQKIILELKDKLTSYQGTAVSAGVIDGGFNNPNIEDAQMVLFSLGYSKDEVSGAISRAMNTVSSNATAEEILKESLKVLSV
ncbi:MAG: Holliday junction branch migration protein RuvA, partial [Candidatus Gastranaerophilales bacterium]|nr:Holliday junction branch migration protein RuvA [Candidatus Gastranaerophilales bacterium]